MEKTRDEQIKEYEDEKIKKRLKFLLENFDINNDKIKELTKEHKERFLIEGKNLADKFVLDMHKLETEFFLQRFIIDLKIDFFTYSLEEQKKDLENCLIKLNQGK